FGKGLVQATRPLSYNSQLKVTTAKYYIPSGRCIQAIDYSHRNDDGSVSKVPDSLRVAFKTANGRVVYDGGGVSPDVAVSNREFSEISKTLVNKGYLFDYATRYRAENPAIPAAKAFEMSDADYDKFVAFVSGKDISYSTRAEQSVDELVRRAKEDNHYADISAEIAAIRKKMQDNKAKDLMRYKTEIKELLEQEIASRYYLQKGIVEASFDDDEDILAAVDVLKDSARFQSLLKTSKKN
ncbi:MAG: peptidase S41, partial [Hymenobacteraceae bacterium]|nr:peptidase S41 [Hymenobacteraceae bacterium]MDX5396104.1 peptidase S41 [Hymenobacteraceae bacterium]MDX5443074.1 peptidase S41 [Hymenobacteraceae bacterium]MDX5512169.1 peptidase S41 [Hymenobacteraceae bacterium]